MSITKCVDCERRIDIDIEEAYYGDDDQCLCEDCNINSFEPFRKSMELINKDNVVQNDEPSYKIVRFYQMGLEEKTILTGLTLEQAKNHCQDPSTAGDGWFDGFVEEVK
tara:strand:- start:235 stop:561 length:327 start_codon:yes stop_codon:yes gene_type:complete